MSERARRVAFWHPDEEEIRAANTPVEEVPPTATALSVIAEEFEEATELSILRQILSNQEKIISMLQMKMGRVGAQGYATAPLKRYPPGLCKMMRHESVAPSA